MQIAHLTNTKWADKMWSQKSETVEISPPKLGLLTRTHLRDSKNKTAAFFYLAAPRPVALTHGHYDVAFMVSGAEIVNFAEDIRVRPDGAIAVVGGYRGPATRLTKLPETF